MPENQLAEIFGFPAHNFSNAAERYRKNKLCPYNNKVPSCTKDKARDPLGVCSIFSGNTTAITCPIRFRQNWLVIEDAARFFFGTDTSWTSLQEVRVTDDNGTSAGNIDFVLVAYDDKGRITDFGSLEIQAVYISGNIRKPFIEYMENRKLENHDMVLKTVNAHPDYLSSSRKRLLPQMIYKGAILKAWKKKQAVAVHRAFFDRLPKLPTVDPKQADIAWLIYDLDLNQDVNQFELKNVQTVYTCFEPALEKIVMPSPGPVNNFVELLQKKLDDKHISRPDAPALNDITNT
ncbi:NotI family restriction endonuclease [Desulfobacterales bacterium HSG16]|nr:NotI family restriction endonuclease [Desulfobacterales bacterium HSG16]